MAAQSENSKNIFADFVASLENDLDQPSGGAPLKKQKTEKKRKAPKKRETTSTYKGGNLEINEGDKSEKIVRNLFSQITVQISAFWKMYTSGASLLFCLRRGCWECS